MSIKIETKQLILREFNKDDAEKLNSICTQKSVLKWMPDWDVSLDDMNKWIEWVMFSYENSDRSYVRIMLAVTLKETGELIGMVGVGNKEEVDNEVEIAYFIKEDMSGMGYTTEAVQALANWAIKRFGLEYLIAIVDVKNHPSRRVMEKSGFSEIDKRKIHNSGENRAKLYYYYRFWGNK